MRNNAAYLPENPIVYIIFPESIHNRASSSIFVEKVWDRYIKTAWDYAEYVNPGCFYGYLRGLAYRLFFIPLKPPFYFSPK